MPSKQEIEAAKLAIQDNRRELYDTVVEATGSPPSGASNMLARDMRDDIAWNFATVALEAAEKVRWQPISKLDYGVLVVGKEDGGEYIGRLVPPYEEGEKPWFTEVDFLGESIVQRHPTEFKYILPTPPEGE